MLSSPEPPSASSEQAESFVPDQPLPLTRPLAILEVLICSGFPTQLVLITLLHQAGFRMQPHEGGLSVGYVVTLSLVDATVLVGLILMFLRIHGERPRELFLGTRPVARELAAGALYIPLVFSLVLGTLALVQGLAPWLHNVERNPLEDLIRTPRDAWLFALVAIVAGGLREELQRAFILRRFEQQLGGAWLGLVLFSAAFGAGHVIQGWDAALVTGLLGATWGVIYLRRRSVVAPAVSHAGFNLAEIARHVAFG